MSKPLLLQNTYTAGMKRDYPRNRMPPNSAWTLKDVVLEYGAPARERGGWAAASNSVSAASATASYIKGGIFTTFSPTAGETNQNLCVDEDGVLYIFDKTGVSSGNAVTAVGAANVLAQNPVFHGGAAASGATAVYTGLVILPDSTGTNAPKVYDGTTLATMHGSPPSGKYATVYKDYTVLGNGKVSGTAYPNRIWFSPAGDPDCFGISGVTAWDTTDSWIDFTVPVRGLVAAKNALLVFGDGSIARVRGSTPPPDTDMVVDDPWQQIGLLDPFSITTHQDIIYWCSPEGVFRTDGVYLDDITAKGGMLRYWLDMMVNFVIAGTGLSCSTGIIRNHLIISLSLNGVFTDAFMVNLQTYAWTQLTNFIATSMWDGTYYQRLNDDTFFGRRDAALVGRLETIFSAPSNSTYKNDGNGTAVACLIETPFYEMGRPGIKNVKGLHIGYQLTDHASDNPTIAVSYVDSPEATSYTSIGTLAENTAYDRKRLQLGGRFYGLGLKLARANAGDFLGYDLSAEVGYQEESKRKT